MKNAFFYQTRFGKIGLAESEGKITNLFFGGVADPAEFEIRKTELLTKAAAQLEEYFEGKRRHFDLPLAPEGTEFEKKTWSALLEIPYGETRSYADIAAAIGNPKASRAVGGANNRNPLAILIPCHRVIGANGSLTGYAGGLEMKKALLDLEKISDPELF